MLLLILIYSMYFFRGGNCDGWNRTIKLSNDMNVADKQDLVIRRPNTHIGLIRFEYNSLNSCRCDLPNWREDRTRGNFCVVFDRQLYMDLTGIYKCSITKNDGMTKNYTVDITVLDGNPILVDTIENKESTLTMFADEGSPFIVRFFSNKERTISDLRCDGVNVKGKNITNKAWSTTHNDVCILRIPMPVHYRVDIDATLNISRISPAMAGNITCDIWYKNTAEVKFIIMVKVNLAQKSIKKHAQERKPLRVSCESNGPTDIPIEKCLWHLSIKNRSQDSNSFESKDITNSSNKKFQCHYILPTVEKDFQELECRLMILGVWEIPLHYKLVVKDDPVSDNKLSDIPMIVVCAISAAVVVVAVAGSVAYVKLRTPKTGIAATNMMEKKSMSSPKTRDKGRLYTTAPSSSESVTVPVALVCPPGKNNNKAERPPIPVPEDESSGYVVINPSEVYMEEDSNGRKHGPPPPPKPHADRQKVPILARSPLSSQLPRHRRISSDEDYEAVEVAIERHEELFFNKPADKKPPPPAVRPDPKKNHGEAHIPSAKHKSQIPPALPPLSTLKRVKDKMRGPALPPKRYPPEDEDSVSYESISEPDLEVESKPSPQIIKMPLYIPVPKELDQHSSSGEEWDDYEDIEQPKIYGNLPGTLPVTVGITRKRPMPLPPLQNQKQLSEYENFAPAAKRY